jgi:anti-sigma-K factor RskA
MPRVTDEDDILAAEFALGLLDDGEAQAVQDRARTDATLSLRIAWWRDQLAPMVREVETPAPDHVWARVAAQLPGNDNSMTLMQRWRAVAVGAMSVAAALMVFIGTRPAPVIVTPAAPMVAALSGDKGSIVAVSYDAGSGKLVVAPTTLDPGRGDAELWIIPAGGTPVSLGVVDARLAQAHNVPSGRRSYVQPGATFAITQEAKSGSPDGKPHGPIVASGKIIRA